jgi:Spy/CpxP family protein refolding chaperone
MKPKWIGLSLAALSMGLAVSAAAMQQSGWFPRRAAGMLLHRVEWELALTDAQRAQIKAILKTEQPTIQALATRVHNEQLELQQSEQSFDEARVREFARKHEATAEDVQVEREKIRTEIMQMLTPEQQQKTSELRQQIFERFTERLTNIGDQM